MSQRTGTVFIVGSLLLHGVVAWAMPQDTPPSRPPGPNASTVAFTIAPQPQEPQQPVAPEPEEPPQVEPEPPPKPRREPPAPKPPQPPEPEPPETEPEEPQGSPREAADETEASKSPEPVDASEEAIQTVRSAEDGLAVARPEGDGSGGASAGTAEGEPSVEKGPQTDRAGPPGVDRAALKRDYLRRLMATLSRNRRYPPAAARERMEGVVLLAITIDPGGVVAGVRIARTSGHGLLDRAALQSVNGLERLPRPPPALSARRQTHELTVPLAYSLVD